jgi:hypothetical protein
VHVGLLHVGSASWGSWLRRRTQDIATQDVVTDVVTDVAEQ